MTQAQLVNGLEEAAPSSVVAAGRRNLSGALHGLRRQALGAYRHWAPPQILPAPRLVAQTLGELISSGELLQHVGISLARVAGGFLLGGALGLVLGTAMGLSRRVEQYVHPLFHALNQVPVLGWLPLAMMVFGIGESLKVVIIAQASLVPIAINVFEGIRRVP